MSSLADASRALIATAGFKNPTVTPLKGDLSSRRYFRIVGSSGTAILMELPPQDSDTLPRVLDITRRLEACGLSVPRIFASDQANGAALIEDFGDTHLADLIRAGQPAAPLFSAVIDAFQAVCEAEAEGLSRPSSREMAEWTSVIDGWLPGCDPAAAAELRARLTEHLDRIEDMPRCLSLRDAHAENVIWLADREGYRRAGLIDFQDALLMHPIYDVASLLRDARIDIDDRIAGQLLHRAADDIGLDREEARLAFDLLSLQRNLRIAGIFHRSAKRDGKMAHLAHLPRVLGHVAKAARNPALTDLAHLLPSVSPSFAEAATA